MAASARTNLIAIGIIGALFVIGGINKARSPKAPEPEAQKIEPEPSRGPSKAMMILAAQSAVKERLRDPGSAEFRNEQIGYIDGKPAVVCGEVNAKSGFGGMTGYERYMSNGVGVTALASDMENGDISGAWSASGCR